MTYRNIADLVEAEAATAAQFAVLSDAADRYFFSRARDDLMALEKKG